MLQRQYGSCLLNNLANPFLFTECLICLTLHICIVHVDVGECIMFLQDGRSALHMASKGGHTKTVRVLLQKGADPNQYDDVVSDMI